MTRPRPVSPPKYPVLRFRDFEIVLGSRMWWILLLTVAILVTGILVSPHNGWAGLGVGVAGVMGAVLGALFQARPIPEDYTAQGASAVRGLLAIAQDVEDAQRLSTQLAQAAKAERIQLGIIDVQDRLARVRVSLHTAMSEWDGVAPGSTEEVTRLRSAGSAMLKRMTEEDDRD